jgi:hypothetical protein
MKHVSKFKNLIYQYIPQAPIRNTYSVLCILTLIKLIKVIISTFGPFLAKCTDFKNSFIRRKLKCTLYITFAYKGKLKCTLPLIFHKIKSITFKNRLKYYNQPITIQIIPNQIFKSIHEFIYV